VSVNPFSYGNPITDPQHFFGRKHEVDQVYSRLRNIGFESSSIVGERRIGKTSLLKFMMHPEVRLSYGLDSDKYLFIYLDLQMIDKDTTPLRLWQRCLRQMERSCPDAEVKQMFEEMRTTDTIDTFAIADLFDSMDEKGLFLVFLLDEFENVTANQNFDAAFFYGLRSLATHHHLSLITSSRRELIELCHSEAIRSSPFFNIFANINLRLFSEVEAKNLIDQLLTGTRISFTHEELDLILCSAGYHPYFLQIACYFLFEAYSQGLALNERMKFMSKEFREEASPHFDDYWHNCYEQEKIVLTALALLKRQQRKVGGRTFSLEHLQEMYARSEQTLEHLEKRGLLISESDGYSLFGMSFGEWICKEITDTIHDQQSYEDWLKSNRSMLERLSTKAKTDLGEILPKISDKYRELIITWVSDPKNLILVAGLLKAALGIS